MLEAKFKKYSKWFDKDYLLGPKNIDYLYFNFFVPVATEMTSIVKAKVK